MEKNQNIMEFTFVIKKVCWVSILNKSILDQYSNIQFLSTPSNLKSFYLKSILKKILSFGVDRRI